MPPQTGAASDSASILPRERHVCEQAGRARQPPQPETATTLAAILDDNRTRSWNGTRVCREGREVRRDGSRLRSRLNFSAWPDWWRHRKVCSNRLDRPTKRIATKSPGPDEVAAFPRPTVRECPACRLEVTYARIVFVSRQPCDLRTGRSAGPLRLAGLYGAASTVGTWSGSNGVERIWK
jgi:hypothetical protein